MRQPSGPAGEPKEHLLTTESKEAAEAARKTLARALVKLNLQGEYGVFVTPVNGVFHVYLGRHDGGAIVPTDIAFAARDRYRGRP